MILVTLFAFSAVTLPQVLNASVGFGDSNGGVTYQALRYCKSKGLVLTCVSDGSGPCQYEECKSGNEQ